MISHSQFLFQNISSQESAIPQNIQRLSTILIGYNLQGKRISFGIQRFLKELSSLRLHPHQSICVGSGSVFARPTSFAREASLMSVLSFVVAFDRKFGFFFVAAFGSP